MSLLITKLFVPPVRPGLVERSRLTERLNAGLHRKLTLVSAPAGFGKTTLVSEWIAGSGHPAAWLSLDQTDNDLSRFLSYFIAALQTIETDAGRAALSALQSPQPPQMESILTSLINDIAAISGRIHIILDDYHLIDTQPIHDALAFLLEHLPPQMQLIMVTREDPPLPLSRLRARGQLNELRANDLRFSPSEAIEFLNHTMGLNLSTEDVAALESRTEGWIAGLQLAAISMQGHSDVAGFIRSFAGSHRLVLDYLIEEVIEQQPAEIQDFLCQTAILDRLTGPLCDAVRFASNGPEGAVPAGQNDGQRTLEYLERANLFVVPLDNERHWYRYHHLFADLLRQRLRQTQAKRVSTLHHRAIVWFEQNELPDEAIEHAMRAEAFERAASLIESVADSKWWRSEHSRLGHWLERLPDQVLFSRPYLCILRAGYLFAEGQQDASDQKLRAAEQAIDSNSSRDSRSSSTDRDQPSSATMWKRRLHGRIDAIRSFMASYRSDASEVILHARRALEHLPEEDVIWRATVAVAMGDAYIYEGEYSAALMTYLEVLEGIKAADSIYLYMDVSLKVALNLRAQGKLQQAIEICRLRLQLANDCGMAQSETIGWLRAIWGEVLAEIDDLEGAIQQATEGVELTQRGGNVAMLCWSYLCLTRILFSRRDMIAAEEIIQRVANIARDNVVPAWITKQMATWQVRIWLLQDRVAESLQWKHERGLDASQRPTYLDALEYLALSRILIAEERYTEAAEILDPLLGRAVAGGHTSRAIEILMLQSLALQAQGHTDQAIIALERALILAEPGGFFRVFVDEGPPMARLLYQMLSREITPDFVRRLLAAFPTEEPEQAQLSQTPAQSGLVEPLSERELEVLQLVAQGLTNHEIAARLFLSQNTVKAHSRNIYGKLDVHNRTQAIARARALGILPSM